MVHARRVPWPADPPTLAPRRAEHTWSGRALGGQQPARFPAAPEEFRRAFYDLDDAQLKGPGEAKAFEIMRRLRGYVDRSVPVRINASAGLAR